MRNSWNTLALRHQKDLAAALFGAESGPIASEIVKLSGLGEDAEEEVKNS
ncbi:MAG: hypothetical protein ACLRH0_07080 [Blautia wexlerae]